MRKTTLIIIIAMVPVFIAASVWLKTGAFDTTLEFQARDAISKAWVYDFTAVLQNRTIRGFYQSDSGLSVYRFKKLQRGTWEMKVTAPFYGERTVPINLKRGKNVLDEPVEMEGYTIPGLKRFYVFSEPKNGDLVLELRPVGSDGRAIVNHPCLDIWIGCRVSVQIKDGVFIQEPTREGSTYGTVLFSGQVPWEWDPAPHITFRYRATLSLDEVKSHQAPYWVLDYLIIVADPRKISRDTIDTIVGRDVYGAGFQELGTALDSYSDELQYFIYRSWNVPSPLSGSRGS